MVMGIDEDLDFVLNVLKSKYELKNRGRLGSSESDVRNIDILGRVIELHEFGVSWTGDTRHQGLLEEYFGMGERTRTLEKNGYLQVEG